MKNLIIALALAVAASSAMAQQQCTTSCSDMSGFMRCTTVCQ